MAIEIAASAPGPAARAPRAASTPTGVAVCAAGLLGLLVALTALTFRLTGGAWYVVETPSMGESAPVGTLVVTAPLGDAPLRTGDLIAFHPPTEREQTYTHRVVGFDPSGRILTRGDINGTVDGWRLTRTDVIGRAIAVLPDVGRLIRGLPLVLVAGGATWLVTAPIRRADIRLAVRLVGVGLVGSALILLLHPFAAVTLLQAATTPDTVHATVVATGMLPVSVTDGTHRVILHPGQVGTITAPMTASGRFGLDVGLALPWSGWLLLALACLLPVAGGLVARPSRERR